MSSSRSKKFFYNTLFTALLQVVTILSGFVVPKIMLRFYGSEINGLVTSITQFIGYFNLVEAGLSGAAVYALYKPLAEEDEEQVSRIVSASKKFYVQSGYVFTALTVLLSVLYPLYIGIDDLSPFWVGCLILVLGSNGFLEFFTLSKYRVLLTADQKTYVISLASIVQVVVQMLIIAILAPLGMSIVAVRGVAIVSILLRSVLLYVYCRVKYPRVNYKAEPDVKALNKRWDALFLQILGVIHKGTTVLLLTVIVKDLTLVSVYAVFQVVVGGLNSILEIFNSGLSASFGEVIARGQKATLQKAYREFEYSFYTLAGLIFSVGLVMIMPFVGLYTRGVTDVSYHMPLVAYMMLIDGFCYHLKTPQGMLVIAAGMYKETRWRSLIQGLIALVGGVILAFPFGIYGILFASILSNVYRVIDLWWFANRHITGLSPRHSIFNTFFVLAEMGVMLLPFFFLDITCTGWMSWLMTACAVFAYAVIVAGCFSFLFRWKQTVSVLRRIKNIFVRR